MRSRQSVIGHTPRKAAAAAHPHPHLQGRSGSDTHLPGQALTQSQGQHTTIHDSRGPASPDESALEYADDQPFQDVTLIEEEDEREQRLIYLRQAFCGFFRAKQGVEMQNLARVMCAILGVGQDEQLVIMESIARLVPALVATTTLESLSYNFSSLFS